VTGREFARGVREVYDRWRAIRDEVEAVPAGREVDADTIHTIIDLTRTCDALARHAKDKGSRVPIEVDVIRAWMIEQEFPSHIRGDKEALERGQRALATSRTKSEREERLAMASDRANDAACLLDDVAHDIPRECVDERAKATDLAARTHALSMGLRLDSNRRSDLGTSRLVQATPGDPSRATDNPGLQSEAAFVEDVGAAHAFGPPPTPGTRESREEPAGVLTRDAIVAAMQANWQDPAGFHEAIAAALDVDEAEYAPVEDVDVPLPSDWLARAQRAIDLDHGSNDEEHDLLTEVMDAWPEDAR
jgi:hypothetical protein